MLTQGSIYDTQDLTIYGECILVADSAYYIQYNHPGGMYIPFITHISTCIDGVGG